MGVSACGRSVDHRSGEFHHGKAGKVPGLVPDGAEGLTLGLVPGAEVGHARHQDHEVVVPGLLAGEDEPLDYGPGGRIVGGGVSHIRLLSMGEKQRPPTCGQQPNDLIRLSLRQAAEELVMAAEAQEMPDHRPVENVPVQATVGPGIQDKLQERLREINLRRHEDLLSGE